MGTLPSDPLAFALRREMRELRSEMRTLRQRVEFLESGSAQAVAPRARFKAHAPPRR